MKIIRVISSSPAFNVDFHPDSAMLLPGRPVFYPDFGKDWMAVPYVAVRVNRLGKSISEKFASRYYDALSVAVRIVPSGGCDIPEGVLSGMDCSINFGEWICPQEFFGLGSVMIGDVPVGCHDVTKDVIDSIVSEASRLTSLRMGDVLMIPVVPECGIAISPRMRVVALCDSSRELLNIKVV